MRTLFLTTSVIIIAATLGIVVQILIHQGNQSGDFLQRVAAVLEKQFGNELVATPPPPAAMAPERASGRSVGIAVLPPELSAAVRITAEQYAGATRMEMENFKLELKRQAETRDRESFWTDVRLNTIFMLLGLGAPFLMRRFGF